MPKPPEPKKMEIIEKPIFRDDYEMQLVDADWLKSAVKPKNFIDFIPEQCILCEGCVDICPWYCIFMLDPTAPDAASRAEEAIARRGLRTICLFPAMHHVPLHNDRIHQIVSVAANHPGAVVFVHCGMLSVGVRKKLGLPSRFDMSLSNPIDLHRVALEHPRVNFVVPRATSVSASGAAVPPRPLKRRRRSPSRRW